MPLIGARFGFKRELAAGIAPIFRRVRGTLDAKFLEGIHRDERLRGPQRRSSWKGTTRCPGEGYICSQRRPYIGAHTIHRVVIRFRALPVHAELARLAESNVAILRGLRDGPRREQNQILKAAAIEGHVLYVRLIHHGADRRIRRIDHRRTRLDGDALGDRADL